MEPKAARNKRQRWLRAGILFSVALFGVWFILGASSTVAWYTSVPEAKLNQMIIGDVSVELFHEVDGEYEKVDENVSVFKDEALYEPGYVQTVFLKVKNVGTVNFDYRLSVTPENVVDVLSKNDTIIHLPDYLRFGMAVSADESELKAQVADRDAAKALATSPLGSHSEKSCGIIPGGEEYAVLVIYMPEETDNAANYRGKTPPSVDLGVTVIAAQENTIDRIN